MLPAIDSYFHSPPEPQLQDSFHIFPMFILISNSNLWENSEAMLLTISNHYCVDLLKIIQHAQL